MQKMRTLLAAVVLMVLAFSVSAAPILAQAAPAGDQSLNFSRLMGRIVGGIIIVVIVLKLTGVGKKKG